MSAEQFANLVDDAAVEFVTECLRPSVNTHYKNGFYSALLTMLARLSPPDANPRDLFESAIREHRE